MATISWRGTAPATKQKDILTVGGTIEADDRFIITLTRENGTTEILNVAAGATDPATVASNIAAAAAGLTSPAFAAITWLADGPDVIAEAKTPGVPFYAAVSTTEAGGGNPDDQTFSRSADTPNSGPNDWNVAENWSTGTKPAASDIVFIENSSVDILYGLNQAAVTLSALHIRQSFEGRLGQPSAYLRISASEVRIGEHYGSTNPTGSPRIKLDLGTTQTAVWIFNSARYAAEPNLPPIRLVATHSSNRLTLQRGRVGICCESCVETSTVHTIDVGYVSQLTNDANLIAGPGLTINTINVLGGSATIENAVTNVNVHGGAITLAGNADIGAITCTGGTLYAQTSGTIDTIYHEGGTIDFDRCLIPRQVSNLTILKNKPGRLRDTARRITFGTISLLGPLDLTW